MGVPDPVTWRHGSVTTYNYGCRCPECSRVRSQYTLKYRRRRMAKPVPGHLTHGASVYTNYGCRCDICTAENSARCSEYRQKRKAG